MPVHTRYSESLRSIGRQKLSGEVNHCDSFLCYILFISSVIGMIHEYEVAVSLFDGKPQRHIQIVQLAGYVTFIVTQPLC